MDYKIITKNNIYIVTLSGNLERKDKDLLTACSKELEEANAKSIVLHFKNVTSIDPLMLRDLTLFQHEIRKRNVRLKIVGLNLQLKTLLSEKGVIRSNEIEANLSEVLFSLSKLY